MSPTFLRRALLIAAICLWLFTLVVLLNQPAASLSRASGLYASESLGGPRFRWSGDRVVIPLAAQSGPTDMILALDAVRWAERPAPRLGLRTPTGELASFIAPVGLRRYHLQLPPGTTALIVESSVDLPPGDPRWLGVAVYSLRVTPSGLPLGVLSLSLALLPIYLGSGMIIAWASRRGLLAPLLLYGLALILRTLYLSTTPPGWRVDEVVSLVDAWHLAQTGRDHLGHWVPLGAFEALGDWISPLLTYLELPFVAIFGPQRMVGRLVTASIGALTAPLGYALARTLGLGRSGALATGLAMALSPWQISISRTALPPALVPTFWSLCLLAGVRFIQRGDRRSALELALAAGLALYAYPTLKLASPFLVALVIVIASLKQSETWSRPRLRLPASLSTLALAGSLLALLWLPFIQITLFNPASANRLSQTALQAESWQAWMAAWWQGYRVYFWPDFYYRSGDGSSITGIPGYGVELWGSLPLVLLGSLGLIRSSLRSAHGKARAAVIFIVGAILIAALPSSLTTPSPHTYRAVLLAPLYALLVGYGVTFLLGNRYPRLAQLTLVVLVAAMLWQGSIWWRAYTQDYPTLQAGLNNDGLAEAVERAMALAPDYDAVWVSQDSIDIPYMYVLAARAIPAAEAHERIVVERRIEHLNAITSIGPYQFVPTDHLPHNLPSVAAVPGSAGGKGYVVQVWHTGDQRILVVRKM